MEFKHLVIHKDTDWHSAFPEIIRLKNGDFVCVFRQAPVRKVTGVHRERNAKVTHFHQDANSRIPLVSIIPLRNNNVAPPAPAVVYIHLSCSALV